LPGSFAVVTDVWLMLHQLFGKLLVVIDC